MGRAHREAAPQHGARIALERDGGRVVRAEDARIDVHVDQVRGRLVAEAAGRDLGEARADGEQAVAVAERILRRAGTAALARARSPRAADGCPETTDSPCSVVATGAPRSSAIAMSSAVASTAPQPQKMPGRFASRSNSAARAMSAAAVCDPRLRRRTNAGIARPHRRSSAGGSPGSRRRRAQARRSSRRGRPRGSPGPRRHGARSASAPLVIGASSACWSMSCSW